MTSVDTRPSEFFVFDDHASIGGALTIDTTKNVATSTSVYGASPGTGIAARHLETLNVLYCDGHVKSQKLQNLLSTTGGVYTNFTIQDD